MKTVVSVTPISISSDSRTFKIAASFARFGYRSIVVEGQRSARMATDLPFEVFSPRGRLLNRVTIAGPSKCADRNPVGRGYVRRWIKSRILHHPMAERKVTWLMIDVLYYIKHFLVPLFNAIPPSDLYYLHAPYQFPAVYWASRLGTIPIVYDAHDFYPVVSPHPFYRRLEEWCVRKAAAVVTVSAGVALLMNREFGCRPVILRNSHDVRLDRATAKGIREQIGVGEGAFCIISTGNAKVGQGIVHALRAMTSLPSSVHLIFLGKDYEPYVHLLDSMRLQGRVHILPPVMPDEVVPFIRDANASLILYFPGDLNYENALPNKFFQAVSAELPLIYPELPEIKKIAQQYQLGIAIDTQSPESIQAAVMRLVMRPETVSQFKRNVREARPFLSWEHEEAVLHNLIRQFI